MDDSLDWIIVGGGIHGVHLAVRLLGEAKVAPERLRIVDPAEALLTAWRWRAANTGMRYLRSPAVHHVGLDPWSLVRFAGGSGPRRKPKGLFAPPYDRPSVELFDQHCDHLVERFGLSEQHVRATVLALDPTDDHVEVDLDDGRQLRASRVLLAMGAGDRPRWPEWAEPLRDAHSCVHHIFEPGFVLDPETWPARVVVVGGGITAAQAALRFVEAGREVTLVARHDPREHQFDADPGWVGPKNMYKFATITDLAVRRRTIGEARHTGSVSPDVARALRRAIERDQLRWLTGNPVPTGDGLSLAVGGTNVATDSLLFATGFVSSRPGGALVDRLVEHHGLPVADCGYPVVDRHLRWHPRICVSGPLAELETGPVSRNIVGARRAAERIVPLVNA